MQFKSTGAAPATNKPPTLDDEGNLLFRNDSLPQSATHVIGKVLSNVGLSSEKSHSVDGCQICLDAMDEELGNLYTVPGCSHTFHKTCIAKWKEQSRTCPCCRGTLSEENLPPEVQLDMNESAYYITVILCPFFFIYPLLLLLCFILFVSLVGVMLLVVTFAIALCESMREEAGDLYAMVCLPIAAPIAFSIALLFMYLVIVIQIIYMLFRIVKFYIKVLKRKIHWTGGYSYVIDRTVDLTSHYFDMLF